MKKNKRHLYKRLPKYALGTMKPIDLGYQPGRGIGSTKFDTELNMSLEPETQAIRKSALPNALGYITQQTPYITEGLKSPQQTTTATASTSLGTIGSTPASTLPVKSLNLSTTPLPKTPTWQPPEFITSGITHTIDSTGSTITNAASGGFSYNLSQDAVKALSEYAGEETVKQGAKSATTSTLGAAMGAVGTALGAYTMANQIADFGSHRNSSDMMANVGRLHVTTNYGNLYTAYNGVNKNQEIAYERANTRSKQLGFGMNAIGTGASLGGMLGSLGALGSIGGPLGTALGAGVGLLVGGLGSLFGWGDNEDAVREQIALSNDNLAMYNRQQEAVAKSKDVAAEFNDRLGVAAAEGGKSAYGPMKILRKYTPGKNNFNVNSNGTISYGPTGSKIQGQEVIGNPNGDAAIAPGDPKEGDVVNSSITPYDDNFVISNRNPYIKNARNIVKDQNRLDHIIANAGGSKEQQWLQIKEAEKMKKINTNKLMEIVKYNPAAVNPNAYKNGKLPGFWRGTDYLMSAIPHIAALGSSWNLYNRAKYADMPDYPNIVDSSANTEAINILGRRRFNPEPILNMLNDQHRHALYELHRMPGLTAGGQAQAMANLNIKTSRAKAEALAQADEINNKYTADYANALANYGKWMSEMMTNNNYARAAFRQQLNAAKEGWMAQYEKNGLTALADLASDVMGVRQFNRSEDYQNNILRLYNQLVENDSVNAKAALALAELARLDREAAYRNVVKDASKAAYPAFASLGLLRPDGLWNLFGYLNTSQLSAPAVNPKYMKYFKPLPLRGYEDGKGVFVQRGKTIDGAEFEDILPVNPFTIGGDQYSSKMILANGDTVYQTPSIFATDYVRKKGGPASKEYIKAKQKHEKLLRNALPTHNIGWSSLLKLFGIL